MFVVGERPSTAVMVGSRGGGDNMTSESAVVSNSSAIIAVVVVVITDTVDDEIRFNDVMEGESCPQLGGKDG